MIAKVVVDDYRGTSDPNCIFSSKLYFINIVINKTFTKFQTTSLWSANYNIQIDKG